MNAVRTHIAALLLLLLPVSCWGAPVYRDVDGCKIAVPASWVAVRNAMNIKGCTFYTADPTVFPLNGIMVIPIRLRCNQTSSRKITRSSIGSCIR